MRFSKGKKTYNVFLYTIAVLENGRPFYVDHIQLFKGEKQIQVGSLDMKSGSSSKMIKFTKDETLGQPEVYPLAKGPAIMAAGVHLLDTFSAGDTPNVELCALNPNEPIDTVLIKVTTAYYDGPNKLDSQLRLS